MVKNLAVGCCSRANALLFPALLSIPILMAVPLAYARDDQKQPVDQSVVVDEAPILSSGFNDEIVANALKLIQTLLSSK